MRTVHELRRRGHDLTLVLAGPAVPYGTSRLHEAEALHDPVRARSCRSCTSRRRSGTGCSRTPSPCSTPTSAEGFGLVPYEAAWVGTPTVFVPFGPLAEMAGELPVTAQATGRRRPSPTPSRRSSATRALGETQVSGSGWRRSRWSWAATAAALTNVFRGVLAKPPASATPTTKETDSP